MISLETLVRIVASLSKERTNAKSRQEDAVSHRRISAAQNQNQKKVKQLVKDDRRLVEMKDERYKYLTGHISLMAGIEPEDVENMLAHDEQFDQFDEFINGRNGGRKTLTLFYQESPDVEPVNSEGKRLFITNGTQEPFTGICVIFQRTGDETKPLNPGQINQEVIANSIDLGKQGLLSGFAELMTNMMLPSLKALDDWGSLGRDGPEDFIQQLDKFVEILRSAEDGIKGKTALAKTSKEELIELVKSPIDCQRYALNPDVVAELETVMDLWLGQIETVLTQSEQMRREAHDAGPSAELIYWKSRLAKFANLVEEIKTPRCQSVLRLLHVAKSRKCIRFRELDSRVTVAMNEARDNVKYLYTLDNFMSQLTRCGPVQMIEHLPGLMNAISMIYAVSQYYNTSDRMTSLFVKITNQMIRSCRNYIMGDETKIWDIERDILVKRVDDCVRLNHKYQESFQRAKTRLQETNTERHFEFSENYGKYLWK